MEVMLAEPDTVDRAVQLLNVLAGMAVLGRENETVASDEQPANTPTPRVPLATVTDSRAVQPLKHPSPTLATLNGSVSDLIAEPAKAPSPSENVEVGNTTDSIFEPPKALAGMVLAGYAFVMPGTLHSVAAMVTLPRSSDLSEVIDSSMNLKSSALSTPESLSSVTPAGFVTCELSEPAVVSTSRAETETVPNAAATRKENMYLAILQER